MVKRRMGLIAFFLCLCFILTPCAALAASTTDASEPIATDKVCSLTVFYGYDAAVFAEQSVRLYKVADVSADFQYTLTAPFADSGLVLNGIQTQGEWNVIRATLEAQILANNIAPTETGKTNASGQASFPKLTPGLYLTSAMQVKQGASTYRFDSALIALPGMGTDGLWQYSVTATAKAQVLPPEDVQLKVIKLWKGDTGRADRPSSIEIEIFYDGVSYDTITLSKENNWSYTWTAKKDGGSWKVVERNIPAGYTMTVEERETSFTVINTLNSDEPSPPPPQTGDTMNIWLYITLMILSGSMLIIIGIAEKRSRYEKTN